MAEFLKKQKIYLLCNSDEVFSTVTYLVSPKRTIVIFLDMSVDTIAVKLPSLPRRCEWMVHYSGSLISAKEDYLSRYENRLYNYWSWRQNHTDFILGEKATGYRRRVPFGEEKVYKKSL